MNITPEILRQYDDTIVQNLRLFGSSDKMLRQCANGAIKYHSTRVASGVSSADTGYEEFSKAIASLTPEELISLYRKAAQLEVES